MNQKIYPNDVVEQIQAIGNKLSTIFNNEKTNLRSISKFANMSVNSVKSVLAGKTGNIATYALVAKALGTDLITVISEISNEVSADSGLDNESPSPNEGAKEFSLNSSEDDSFIL